MIKRLIPVVLMLALIGCSSGTEVTVLARDELPSELYGESTSRQIEERTVTTRLYFLRTDESGVTLVEPVRLVLIEHDVRSTRPEIEEVTRLLLRKPVTFLPPEKTVRIGTAIQEGTELLSVSVDDGVADVNLSAQFESAESELLQLLRVAQVVYTLTELSEVNTVRFSIHGATQPVVDQDGMAHETVSREQYSRFAPVASELGEEGESQVRAD